MARIKEWGSKKGFMISVEGYNIVLENIKLTKDQRKNLEHFIKTEADKVIDHAQETVPWDTGALHDTHRKAKLYANQDGVAYDIRVGNMTARGKFVNYAQKVHRNDPWLLEAFEYEMLGFRERAIRAIKVSQKGSKSIRIRR
jgi:hypothetical protein